MHCTSCTVAVALMMMMLVAVLAKPAKYSTWEEYKEATGKRLQSKDNRCRNGGPVRDLCEKCSKVTRNEVVFPLCCEDDDDEGVRAWCRNFLGYTLKEN